MTTILATLRAHPLRPYLATPYSKYWRGLHGAYMDANKLATRIYRELDLRVFSPICHGHGFPIHGDYPSRDDQFWKNENRDWVAALPACIVGKLKGWDESVGVRSEIHDFRAARKTVLFIDPETLELTLA